MYGWMDIQDWWATDYCTTVQVSRLSASSSTQKWAHNCFDTLFTAVCSAGLNRHVIRLMYIVQLYDFVTERSVLSTAALEPCTSASLCAERIARFTGENLNPPILGWKLPLTSSVFRMTSCKKWQMTSLKMTDGVTSHLSLSHVRWRHLSLLW